MPYHNLRSLCKYKQYPHVHLRYPEGLTVKELIEKEDVETPQYVTVTINDEFVESGAFESTEVKDGDEIEFLYFMGGGAR